MNDWTDQTGSGSGPRPGDLGPDDDLERALRGALHREADLIDAHPGDLPRLQERIAHEQTGRRPAWLPWLAAAAAVLTLGGISGALLAQRPDVDAAPAATSTPEPTASAPASPEPSASAEPDATPSPTSSEGSADPTEGDDGGATTVPVYWVAESGNSFRLYREFLPASARTAQQAVETLLTEQPLDPDYVSVWRPAPVEVTVTDDLITVDVGAAAFSNTDVGSETAAAAVQSLVYTATAGAAVETGRSTSAPVRILVDGETDAEVWGVIALDEPIARDPLAPADVWILSPQQGASRPAPVTVQVSGIAFEATLLWQVTPADDPDGDPLAHGFIMVGGGLGDRRTDSFTVTLPPGEYRILVYAPDESDGEAGFPMPRDDKVITIT